MGKILTGTASWSDPGFVEAWYPRKLPASQRLSWYAERFNLVEVNSTFYRLPDARTTRKWCEQTPDGFVFDVKLHRSLSKHSTKMEMLPPEIRAKAKQNRGCVELTSRLQKKIVEAFLSGISPLRADGKLGALLLQLSPSFGPRHYEIAELDPLLELLASYSVAVEFRNRGWVDDKHLAQTQRFFEDRNVTFVMVDGPNDPHFMIMPGIDLITSPRLAYLRAHGRNAAGYIRERTVAGRFNYDYSRSELEELAGRTVRMAREVSEMHVIYNNNKADYAPRAAATFQKILAEDQPGALPRKRNQKAAVHA